MVSSKTVIPLHSMSLVPETSLTISSHQNVNHMCPESWKRACSSSLGILPYTIEFNEFFMAQKVLWNLQHL